MVMTPERWLQVQFNKKRSKGYRDNAELNPAASEHMVRLTEAGEVFLVRIVSTSEKHYWLSDRRVLAECKDGISTLFRYDAARRVHWMFKDPLRRTPNGPKPEEEMAKMKLVHGDRLEVELDNGEVILEHLGPAYGLVFEFLRFLIKAGDACRVE